MATIAENLQTIKEAVENIKQAIIAKGGTVSGDLTTYANAIESLALGGGNSVPDYIVMSDVPNTSNAAVCQFLKTLIENTSENVIFEIDSMYFPYYNDFIDFRNISTGGKNLRLYGDGKTAYSTSGGAD